MKIIYNYSTFSNSPLNGASGHTSRQIWPVPLCKNHFSWKDAPSKGDSTFIFEQVPFFTSPFSHA